MAEPSLVSGLRAQFVPAKWDGTDKSGIRCVGKTVLVLMDECAEVTGGGVALPIDVIERQTMAAESGVLVKAAEGAFLLNEDMTPWSGPKPQPGERVYIEKYAGKQVRGNDGRIYRLMDYGFIGAVFEAEAA